ncbi:MAG: serine/threonine-protein kinase, partial [Nannocystaceae bacterium]
MASNHLNEGAIIDERYVVRTEIGIGNMATVYLAEDAIAQRSVAIKVMSERLVGRPDRERRFFNEDRFQALLANHPNVVRTYGHGRVSGPDSAPYLAMEHVAGPSLGLLITVKKCLEPEHVVHLGLGIANGLRAIHRAGIVHRDVKPDNILVAIAQSRETADEVAKIADFGLAIQLTDAQGAQVSRMTHHLAIPGSSGYIAPEATSFAVPSPSMDVFGLGMVLLEALTGINPYAETSREAYLEEIARPEWAIPSAALAEVACAPLRALVAECTQRDPNARPTIDEVIGRLETI